MSKGGIDRTGNLLLALLIAAVLVAGAAWPSSPRGFQVLVFAAMLAALGGTGCRLAAWLVPELGRLSRLVAAFSFGVAIAGVPATWMGHFGVLRPAVFLGWTATVWLASRWIPAGPASHAPAPDNLEQAGTAWPARIETALVLTAAAAIAVRGLASLFRARFEPPGIYDDLSYHLSEVATWIQHGDLRMLRFSMGDASPSFYPVLGEVVSWVLIAPFRDSDAAARWTQLPFALFSFLAAAAIARRLGLSRRAAGFAAVLYASIPHVFPFLAMGAGNDHAVSFFTLAAGDAGHALARRPRPGAAVATGTALGLLLASKYIGLLYAPVVLGLLVLVWLGERRRTRTEESLPARRLAGPAVLLAAALAVTAGYTYLRNAVSTGNPIFPAPVQILGFEIFPGWGGVLSSERSTAPESRIDIWEFLARNKRLFGPFFPFTMLPAAVLAPLVALGRRRWTAALALSLPAVFFLQFLFLMHDHRDNRYFLPGVALAAVAFAWLLDRLGPRTLYLRAALLAAICIQTIGRLGIGDLREALLGLSLLGLGFLAARGERSWGGQWRWLAAVLPALAALPLGKTVATYQATKLLNRPSPLALERLAGPDGTRVAYAGMNQPYPYFGSRFQNDVQIVPTSGDLEAQYYRWGSSLGNPYRRTTYRRWRRNLERRRIELVVVVLSQWADPERGWMVRRSRDFRKVYEDAETEIWRVLPAPAGASGRRAADRPGRGRRGPGAESRPGPRSGSRSSGPSARGPG